MYEILSAGFNDVFSVALTPDGGGIAYANGFVELVLLVVVGCVVIGLSALLLPPAPPLAGPGVSSSLSSCGQQTN